MNDTLLFLIFLLVFLIVIAGIIILMMYKTDISTLFLGGN